MNTQSWLDWCTKQLADLSVRLFRQGYHPERIQYLAENNVEFSRYYEMFHKQVDVLMEDMIANPSGYHHYDAFSRLKTDFLHYACLNREFFLELNLAQIA